MINYLKTFLGESKFIYLSLWLTLGFLLALLYSCSHNSQAQNQFQLNLPVKCNESDNCFILLYSDRDKSSKATDFNCGFLTYDGHKGTDFAIPSTATMNRGIPVVATAKGTVLRVRDGVEDKRFTGDRNKIEGKECGNGIVIDHGGGWQTQYCHLRRGSVKVKPQQTVTAGEEIGLVGMSGLASFPHVHLQVSYQGEIVDPFVGLNSAPGCQVEKSPLWAMPLDYTPTGLIRSGFATEIPQNDDLWNGKYTQTSFLANSPLLVFWIQSYGVLANDQEYIELIDPQGNIVAQARETIEENRKTWLRYTGKRASNSPLLKGNWRGKYQLKRQGKIIIDVEKTINIT